MLARVSRNLKITFPTPGARWVHTDLPDGLGLSRKAGLPNTETMRQMFQGNSVLLGTAAAGDFPGSPEDGWATARAYREHVLRVVQRLREDSDAAVEVAEVDGRGRRLHAWAPGDENVRPKVLADIRAALGLPINPGKQQVLALGLHMSAGIVCWFCHALRH